mgnify:CR=1 FL=1
MKRRYLLYCFTVIIYIVTIISFIDKDKIFSEFENRNLKTNVRFSINKFVNGSFQEEYEEYINDQFPLRNQWISIKSLNEYLLGKIENNGIIYGENKWLFEKFTSLNKVKLSNNINAINQFSKKYDKSVSVMIVPNSYEIYNEDLPRGLYQIEQEKIIKDLYSNLIYSNNINLLDKFKNEKNNYIYYKTDHHWTTYGAYLAYCSFIESIGMKPINLNYYNSNEINGFYGSYFSKAKPFNISSDIIKYYDFEDLEMNILGGEVYNSIYDFSKINSRDKYSMFIRGNNALTIINNKNLKNGKKILVIKDSFANSLVPFLTQNFEEVHIIDLRSFNIKISNYMEENDFDNILVLYNFINLSTDSDIIKIKYWFFICIIT